MADLVRYIVAYYSLGWSRPERIAERVRSMLSREARGGLADVARFWLEQPNLEPPRSRQRWSRQKAKDVARGGREFATFRILAAGTDSPVPTPDSAYAS
jgi:hypothetical protein